ncbi:ROK family protein [Fundicoccus culcitae]|uniref:ROK family protein n=1 Tax=Fundicoccus culcitae TaxID=2969821 RepID=A0ABY5P943_9LACT|nr:ROK family protein [Fundicoccus culcitae]UUX35271.1 ROK family protein [Fundicoccus culcitae]
MALLVFDIGGTFIKFGVWDNDTIKNGGKFETPDNWQTLKEKMLETKISFEKKYSLEGVAFSVPGSPNSEKGVIEGESLVDYLHNFPIYQELTEMFHLPVEFENDANCAALAEISQKSDEDKSNILFIVLGTGIGGSLIINNEIINGFNNYAGEFGFMLIDGEEFNFGELATAVAMEKRYADRKQLLHNQVRAEEIFELALDGDEDAKIEVDKFYYYLTIGLYNLTTILNPNKIIIGGGVSSLEGFKERIEDEFYNLYQRINHFPYFPTIEVSSFKNEANLIGAVINFNNKK